MKKNPVKTVKKQTDQLKKYQWIKGQSGNPKGRPKGSFSIKDLVRQHLEKNPEDMMQFVKHFIEKNRELAWQMLEGKPQQDIVSDGKQLPTPLLSNLNVSNNDSDTKDSETPEENQSDTGGDISS